MAILATAHQLKKAYGARPLFEGISLAIESGERIGLIGPNGAGKSTLLRILAGQVDPDEGSVARNRGLRVGFLAQVPEFAPSATILESVLEGATRPGLDANESERIARALLSQLEFQEGPDTPVERLSGGWKKRVALARELAREPDLLLLDEPTNHLDVEGIEWLEDFLSHAPFATLTITHDRAFLQKAANRILELDRRNPGGLLSVKGAYADYLVAKEALLSAQESRETRLANVLRRETEWLRRGAKARTTKQQARIQRAGSLADEVSELSERNRSQSVRLDFQASEKNPKKLLTANGITKRYGDRVIVPPFDLLLTPQSRIGLLGANGCGKSTLLKLLFGDEAPDSGTVTRSDSLKPVYFEQNRESLDPEATVLRTLCPTGDFVHFRGQPLHVQSYLDRFLFDPAQREMKVGKLSGGEQSRILIAKLMLEETNCLILDEPTNDLDLPTLSVLEEVLSDFPGAVLLVTHDRAFLDHVTEQIYAFVPDDRGSNRILPFHGIAQWEDWLRAERKARAQATRASASKPAAPAPSPAAPPSKRKLSYKDQRELDGMEDSIHAAEEKLARLTAESEKPEHASNSIRLTELSRELALAQAEVDRLYARWAELSGE